MPSKIHPRVCLVIASSIKVLVNLIKQAMAIYLDTYVIQQLITRQRNSLQCVWKPFSFDLVFYANEKDSLALRVHWYIGAEPRP